MAYGQSGHLAINFQNSFGTSLTTSRHFIPLISETVGETINQLTEENLYRRFAESPTHEGAHAVEGEVRTEAHPIVLGTFLKAVMGQSTTTAQGSAFLHEFIPVGSDWDGRAAVPPMSIEIHRDAGSAFLYYDVLGNQLSMEIAQGQLLSATLGILGGNFTRKAAAASAYKFGKPWTWDVVSASYDSAAIVDLRRVALTFENQLAPQYTLTSGKSPYRIKRDGPQTLNVEGTVVFQDHALFQEFLDQSEKRLTLAFGGETIAQSYSALLTVDIPNFRFTEFSPQIAGPGQMEVGFSGKGIFDSVSGYAVRFTLTNTQPAY